MVILCEGCTKKSRSKIALLLRFSFFLNFLLFGWEKNRQKKSTRCKFTKFGGWKDLIFLEIVAKNGVKIRPLEQFPLVCLLTEKDVYPWHFGNGSAAYYRGEGCHDAETRVAQRLAGRNASKMHDALPSPRHTSKKRMKCPDTNKNNPTTMPITLIAPNFPTLATIPTLFARRSRAVLPLYTSDG